MCDYEIDLGRKSILLCGDGEVGEVDLNRHVLFRNEQSAQATPLAN
jgi:hypothetical protein